MLKFSAEIYKIGINPVVDPPEDLLLAIFEQAGKARGPISVKGMINGAPFVQTLVRYAGAWRLYINVAMLKDSGLTVGETAKVEIAFDARPRDVPMHSKLKAAFRKHSKAQEAFDLLPPSRQKEILRYVNSLKSDKSVERNVRRVISQLSGTDDEPPAFMRRKRGAK